MPLAKAWSHQAGERQLHSRMMPVVVRPTIQLFPSKEDVTATWGAGLAEIPQAVRPWDFGGVVWTDVAHE